MRTEQEVRERIVAYGDVDSLPKEADLGSSVLIGPMMPRNINLDDPLGVKRKLLLEVGLAPEGTVKNKLYQTLEYGFNKAWNHRGISASIVQEQIVELMWLLGDDEMMQFAENDSNYENYGVPILKAVARKFEHPIPPEIETWEDGKPCCPECDVGCGRGW